MNRTVTMVDTSVLCELLQVPGKSSPSEGARLTAELDDRWANGEKFVIPITTVIETGNHIAQSGDQSFEVARRFVRWLRTALAEESHWRVFQTRLGNDFIVALCEGASTGMTLEALASRGVGAGDVAILVERDQFLATTAVVTVGIWTLDTDLASYAAVGR